MEIESLVRRIDLKVQFETMLDQLVVASNLAYERHDNSYAPYNVYDGRAAVVAAPGTGGVLGSEFVDSFGIRLGLLAIYAIEDVAQVDGVTSEVTVDPYGQSGNVAFYNQLVGEHGMLVDHTDWFPVVAVGWPAPISGDQIVNPTSGPVTRVLPPGEHDIRITLRQADDVPWIASRDPSAVTRVVVP